MADYRFSAIVPAPQMTPDQQFDATDKLAEAGCGDATIRGHADGIELVFTRSADSLQTAIASAIADVERAGFAVSKVELERAAIPG